MIWNRRIDRPPGAARGLGLWWTFAAALVVAAALIIAIAQNGAQVRVHYVVWQARVPLIVIVLTTALVALLLDEAGGLIWRSRRRAKLARRNELAQLRTGQQRPGPAAPPNESIPQAAGETGP
jgi:uncharacterized integral membrane protein